MMNEHRSPVEISIVVPLYNEQDNLEPLLGRIQETLSRLDRSYEVIFVDDGSTDESFQVIQRLHQNHDRIHINLIKTSS